MNVTNVNNITMANTSQTNNRANSLRIRLYAEGKSITWAAKKLGVTREWLSKVLNQIMVSELLLDRLEALLDEEDMALVA